MHARLGFCALLAALSLPALARAEPSPEPQADSSASRKHPPTTQDFALEGGPGWSVDRTLGNALAGTLIAEYRWRHLAAGPSLTAMTSADHAGSSGYSGGLSVSGVWQHESGLRASVTGILGFDRYEDVRVADTDCGNESWVSYRCPGGPSETLPYAELRLRAAYVFPVQSRTHLALGAAFYVGRDLTNVRAGYDKLDGTKGSLELGAARVGVLATAGLTFDLAPVARETRRHEPAGSALGRSAKAATTARQ